MRELLLAVGCAACAVAAPAARPTPRVLAQLEASRDLDGAVVGATDAPATIVIVLASWCNHCHDELGVLDAVRARHRVRVLGVNYRGHEEYDHRGGSAQVRAFARGVPWLRVIPVDDELFGRLGAPPLIPTIYVYDRAGGLVATFDRRERAPPEQDELDAMLARLGT